MPAIMGSLLFSVSPCISRDDFRHDEALFKKIVKKWNLLRGRWFGGTMGGVLRGTLLYLYIPIEGYRSSSSQSNGS
jgi:hypothetical protein